MALNKAINMELRVKLYKEKIYTASLTPDVLKKGLRKNYIKTRKLK